MRWVPAIIRHLNYLLWHKVYVFRAGRRRGVPTWQLIVHDWSKLTPAEFIPYTRHHFLGNGRKDSLTFAAFERAFKLHCARNPHHWEHWTSGECAPYPMPYVAILEMLADWDGTGPLKKNGVTSVEFYTANRSRIKLHPDTRFHVEAELGLKPICPKCKTALEDNVALITNDDGVLTAEQRPAVENYLTRLHASH